MNERREDVKLFDGTKFAVWKFHMQICFEEKEIWSVVNGDEPAPSEGETQSVKDAWNKKNVTARRMISSSVTLPVLENLVNCSTACCMWTTLCSFYQQKSKENIYMVQHSFFDYKMAKGDSINTHINKIMSIGNLLKDLGKPLSDDLILSKMLGSLPPSYNGIRTAWINVPESEQTVANLKVRLLQMEHILATQAGEDSSDRAKTKRRRSAGKHKSTSRNSKNVLCVSIAANPSTGRMSVLSLRDPQIQIEKRKEVKHVPSPQTIVNVLNRVITLQIAIQQQLRMRLRLQQIFLKP